MDDSWKVKNESKNVSKISQKIKIILILNSFLFMNVIYKNISYYFNEER